jgi:hypothetical protein
MMGLWGELRRNFYFSVLGHPSYLLFIVLIQNGSDLSVLFQFLLLLLLWPHSFLGLLFYILSINEKKARIAIKKILEKKITVLYDIASITFLPVSIVPF